MTPEQQKSIDLRMRLEFRAMPLRQMIRWEHGEIVRYVAPYESESQRFWVKFRPDTRTMTVYSFTTCVTV